MGSCILGERVKKVDIIAIIISFLGMTLIIQPFGNEVRSTAYLQDLAGIAIAFVAAIVSAVAVVMNKRLSDNLHFTQINLIYMLSSSIITPIFSFIANNTQFSHVTYNWTLLGLIISIGVSFFMHMVLMNVALRYLSASLSGILLYVSVPTGYLFDYLFLNTAIGLVELLGAAIIVFTNVIIGILLATKVIS